MSKKLGNISNDPFMAAIKNYLDNFSKTDSHFKKCYENPSKSIRGCCSYIVGQVKKMKRVAFCNDEVFQMARHYYLEEIDSKELTAQYSPDQIVCDASEEVSEEKVQEESKILDLESFF